MSRFLRGYPRQPQYVSRVRVFQKVVTVGQAVEHDIALGRHKIAVGQAVETDTSQHIMTPIKVHVGQAVETDTVPGITTPVFDPVVDWGIFIDWYGDGDFGTDGDDVTGRTLARTEVSMQYGRDQARESSPMAAGRTSLELDNRSKDYSPDNQDSPLYGQVLPARPLLIQATTQGTTHTLFSGFTDEFTIQPDISNRSVAITGLDAVAKLQGVKATTQLYSGVRTGTAIGYVLDAIGWPADLRDLDPGATVVRWWWVQDADAFEAISDLVTSEGPPAMLHADEQGRIVFRDRHHRLFNTASTTPQTTFYSDSSDGEPAFSEMTYDHGWREVINSVNIKVDEIDPAAQQQVWQNEGIVTIGSSETLTLQLNLDSPVIEPTLEFDIINGTCSGAITIDSGQTITIELTAGSGGSTITNLEVVGQPVTTSRSYTVLLEDDASILQYGKRSQDYAIPWAGYQDALAVGQIILDASSTRRPIVTIKLISGTWFASDRLTQQLSRDLSDRVHVQELDQTCVDHDFHIEQIQHTATEGGLMLTTEFGMERAQEQASNVFRFNSSTYGFDSGVFASVAMTDPATLFRFDVSGQGFNQGVFAT